MRDDPQRLPPEVLQRLRRIETRVTQIAVASGVETGQRKPEFVHSPAGHGTLHLPSPHTTLNEALAAIPERFADIPVDVYLGDGQVATLTKR